MSKRRGTTLTSSSGGPQITSFQGENADDSSPLSQQDPYKLATYVTIFSYRSSKEELHYPAKVLAVNGQY